MGSRTWVSGMVNCLACDATTAEIKQKPLYKNWVQMEKYFATDDNFPIHFIIQYI